MTQPAWLGIDLGGTNTRVGLVDGQGLLRSERFPTWADEGPKGWVRRLSGTVKLLTEAAADQGLAPAALGLATPGTLDRSRGVVTFIHNLPKFQDFPLAREVADITGLPVALENDSNLHALGEMIYGAGRGASSLACITLGTGVGGGLIIGGRLVVGALGSGGELGHLVVEPGGRFCGCGVRGCLEAYASSSGMKGMLAEAMAREGVTTRLRPEAGVVEMDLAARAGDPLALELFAASARAIGRAVAALVVTCGLDLVIFGGGLAKGWSIMEKDIRAELAARVRLVPAEKVRLVLSELGDDAGVLGAAAYARQAVATVVN